MAFLTSYRAEKVYFEKLRSNIDIAKSYIQRGATDEVMALLQNAVDADGAIMLCYRNLGEVWADLAAQLEKTQKALEDLKTALEEYHDDLNKKIDEINNYLVRLINALDERVTILENESKVKFAYLNHDSVENVYSIEYNGETADFDTLSAALEYPHLLVLIDNENGNIYYPRSVSDVLIDFHADGVSGTDYVDISVTMSDSDVVTVTEKTVVNYTFGTGFNVSNTNEVTPDLTVLQAKLSAGFGIEIDSNNKISVDTNDVQEKLTAGTGIDIDSNNEISVDTNVIQEKLTAGNNISITNNVISATDTTYSEGTGIDIDSNNVISADTTVLQEKLVAGNGIAIDPNTNEISNTAPGATYSAGDGINIASNNAISNKYNFPYAEEDFGSVAPSSWTDYPSQPQDFKRCYYNIDAGQLHNLELAKFLEVVGPSGSVSYISNDTSFTGISLKGIIILRFILSFRVNNHNYRILLFNHTITVRKDVSASSLNMDFNMLYHDLYNLNGLTGKTFSSGVLTFEIGAVFDNIDYGSTHYNGIINQIKSSVSPSVRTIK